MTDLVERLRDEALTRHSIAWSRMDGGQEYSLSATLADEAATEIETLRASISKIEEALEQIAERGTGPDFEPTDAERALYWSEVAIRCRRIASQALNTMNTRRAEK